MSEPIDRLCSDLRIKLHGIDRRLEVLKGNAMATSEKSQHAIESQLGRVEQRIHDDRFSVAAAQARMTAYVQVEKSALEGIVSCQAEKLHDRADAAEARAAAAFHLAAAAADAAIRAALQALLARKDAHRAALPLVPVRVVTINGEAAAGARA